MALALLVMREGGGGGGRADHDVPVVEELVPQEAHLVAPLIGHEPGAVRQDIGAGHVGEIAFVVRPEASDPLEVVGEIRIALAPAGGRAQQRDIDVHRLAAWRSPGRAVIESFFTRLDRNLTRLASRSCTGWSTSLTGSLSITATRKSLKEGLRRRRQLERRRPRLDAVGAGENLQHRA